MMKIKSPNSKNYSIEKSLLNYVLKIEENTLKPNFYYLVK